LASYKRKVGNLLIDRRFQLKYTAFVLLVSVGIFSVLGWFYMRERRTSSELMEVNRIVQAARGAGGAAGVPGEGPDAGGAAGVPAAGVGADDPVSAMLEARESQEYSEAFDKDIEDANRERDLAAFFTMAGVVVLLVLLLGCGGIYITHKVAGPLFALRRFMDAVSKGEWSSVRTFRKGDEFQELADTFRTLASEVRGRHEAELKQLAEVRDALAKGDTAGAGAKLTAVIEAKTNYVKL